MVGVVEQSDRRHVNGEDAVCCVVRVDEGCGSVVLC
jgi:hypothetical protein